MKFFQTSSKNSQPSTVTSSSKSKSNSRKAYISDKENINLLNFSKIAISKSQEKRCITIDFIPNSENIVKLTTENYGPFKFQTEVNSSTYTASTTNLSTNGSHFRYKSIANMPYHMPIHESNLKKPNEKRHEFMKLQTNISQKQKNSFGFQKSFQPQSHSISLQKKQGDLIEIPEISSPEKEDKEESARVYSLMKNFKNLEIVSKQQLTKKASILSSFSNSEGKSMISFPDEITTSAQKNLLFFKKKFHSTPKLLTNILKKHKNLINSNNSRPHAKLSENKLTKILKCCEKLEEIETKTDIISLSQEKTNMKNKQNNDNLEDENINNCVYRFLLQRESAYQLNPHFLRNNQEINALMRAVLIDWMSEVSMEFSLKKQTFQQATYYLDKVLELNPKTSKQTLQLIGVSSLLIASKLEVKYFVFISYDQ